MKGSPARNCTLYLIELDPAILEVSKFSRKKPDFVAGRQCVWVGCTSRTLK